VSERNPRVREGPRGEEGFEGRGWAEANEGA
jgi:hypothetical protein